MNKYRQKPKKWELQEILNDIRKNQKTINVTSDYILNELLIYLNEEISHKINVIDSIWQLNPEIEIEDLANNLSNNGLTLNGLYFYKKLITDYNKESDNIFNGSSSREFFEFLFKEWIVKEEHPKTIVSVIYGKLKENNISDPKMIYSIKGNRREFAEYYNTFIKTKLLKQDIKNYEIKINLGEPQIKNLSTIGNLEKRIDKLNTLLSDFNKLTKTV